MKDVAAMAGVSLSTVSRVVNGSPPVAPDLATRVERAIELLGYRHNHTAGTLRRSSGLSASIGLVFDDVGNPFFAAIHRGIEEVARDRGVVTFAGSTDHDPHRERALVESVLGRRVDGLIVVPSAHDHSYLKRDVATGVGLVFVDRPPETIDADHVLTDNRGGVRLAVEHLLGRGHTRIAYVGPEPDTVYTAAERLAGFEEAMAGRGEVIRAHGDIQDVLAAPASERPTALFSAHDFVTRDVLSALHRLGLQHEIAHVGFDDIAFAETIDPGVTVVAQDVLGLGRTAAELLFSRLDGFNGRARQVVLPTTLIERGSGELQPSS
jgi:LacI family transcriptional regulator